jgi:site-specific DNA recombinase
MPTAIYLRQSLDRHGDMLAVTRQREDLRKLCDRRGWAVTVEFMDNDFSASVRMPGSTRTSKTRPGYERMLAAVRAGTIDAIAVWDADRLYRHPRELEDIIDLADQKKLELATVGGDFDLSTPTGRGNARMKGVFARMEMEQKSVRQKGAAKQHANNGRAWWPSRPFGYTADPHPVTGKWSSKGDIRLDPTEAKLLRDAYTAVIRGTSLHSIAKAWNDAGTATPKGSQWRGAQLRQLLLAPRNAALRSYTDDADLRPASWPAIVTRDQWEAVCAILADPNRRNGVTRGRKYLLSGIAVCGECGHTLGSGITTTTNRPNYQCKNCHKVSRNAQKVDAMVTEAVVWRLSRADAADLTVDHTREDLADLQAQADALRAQAKAADDEYDDGIIDGVRLAARKAKVAEKLAPIKAQLDDADQAEIFDGVIGAGDVDRAFDGLNLDRQRRIIHALLTVTVNQTGRGRQFREDDVDVAFRRPITDTNKGEPHSRPAKPNPHSRASWTP